MTELARQNTPDRGNNINFLHTVEALNNALKMTNDLLVDISNDMNNKFADMTHEQKHLSQRMDEYENSYEITKDQENNITANVRALATKLVGYPNYIYGVTCQDIYRFLRRNYNLATAVGRTERRYYEDILKGLNHYEDAQFNREKLTQHKRNLDEAKMIRGK